MEVIRNPQAMAAIVVGISALSKIVRLICLVMGAALSAFILPGCAPQASTAADPITLEHARLNKNRDVWQLTWIADSFWANTELSAELQASVIDQVKIITWSSDGKIRYSAKWLDCNMPKLDLRRRVVSPAYSVEKEDGSGYETVPAELETYMETIRLSEGCPRDPTKTYPKVSAETYLQLMRIRGRLGTFFETATTLRKNETLTYVDANGLVIAKFEIK